MPQTYGLKYGTVPPYKDPGSPIKKISSRRYVDRYTTIHDVINDVIWNSMGITMMYQYKWCTNINDVNYIYQMYSEYSDIPVDTPTYMMLSMMLCGKFMYMYTSIESR